MGFSRKGLMAKGLDGPTRRKNYRHSGKVKSRKHAAAALLLARRVRHP